MDMRADEAVDARWLTHAELAALRGTSTASAIKLALRHHWRKPKDNHGTLRCLVPPEWATPKPDKGADDRADTGADTSAAINSLQAAMGTLLEAKDGEIANLRKAFEVALSAKNGEIASLREQFERGMAQLQRARRAGKPSVPGPTRCETGSRRYRSSSPQPRQTAAH